MLAPHGHAIQTTAPLTPASRSPHRWSSVKKAFSSVNRLTAWSLSQGVDVRATGPHRAILPRHAGAMTYLVVIVVAFVASGLTFFSGFGLGTLLLPAFALFFPAEHAVALTAVVHFLNGLFKLGLVVRHADLGIVVRFSVPAILASLAGAALLLWLSGIEPLATYQVLGRVAHVTPVKLVVGGLLLIFGLGELLPRAQGLTFSPRYLPLGGALSGFFGGLSGMQGALRSAFLVRANLSKEAFIATGVLVAALIDVSRLGVYFRALAREHAHIDYLLLATAVLAAFAGAMLGNRWLRAMTMHGVRRIVAAMLVVVAVGLAAGLI